MNNVFDARQVVVDETGTVPLRYQDYLIDPVGRFFEIELRKLF
jgi:iron complex outermembrane receptor protein